MGRLSHDRVHRPRQGHAYSRNGKIVSDSYLPVAKALEKMKGDAVIDGELVALDAQGISRFQLLQNALRSEARLLYCIFDIMFLAVNSIDLGILNFLIFSRGQFAGPYGKFPTFRRHAQVDICGKLSLQSSCGFAVWQIPGQNILVRLCK
jgi:hypothetical protein